MNKYLLSLVLGVTGMLVSPGDSHAQRWGGGRSGFGISIGNFGYGSGLGYGNYGYGSGFGYGSGLGYGNYGFGYNNYGYNNWGNPGYGYSNYGYGPWSYGSNYNSYPSYYGSSYSYMPSYYGSNYSSYAPSYAYVPSTASFSSPQSSTSFYYAPSAEQSAAPALGEKATVEVRCPANAEIWIDGQSTTQRGETRNFETPPLPTGQNFSYEIRARWMQDGQPKEDVRTVSLQAGMRPVVDFRSNQPRDTQPKDKDLQPKDLQPKDKNLQPKDIGPDR